MRKTNRTDANGRRDAAERAANEAAFNDMKADADQVEAFLMDTGMGSHKLVAMLMDGGLPGRTKSKGSDARQQRLTAEIARIEDAFSAWSNTRSTLVHTTPLERYRQSIIDDVVTHAKAA